MQSRPLVYVVIAFLIGHITVSYQSLHIWLLSLVVTIILVILLFLINRCNWKLAIIVILIFLTGSVERYVYDKFNISALPYELAEEPFQVSGQGIIISEVDVDGNVAKFVARFNSISSQNNEIKQVNEKMMVHIRLQSEAEQLVAHQWQRGLVITLNSGELSIPATETNKGAFNYRKYLQRQRIHWLLKAEAGEVQTKSEKWNTVTWLHYIDTLRNKLASPLDILFEKNESGYLKGLILGIRSDLDPEQLRSFSTLGLTHILAISGLHVAVFMYIVSALLKLLRRSKEQIIMWLLILIPCYVLLTGASPSVMRAGLMAMIALFAGLKGRLKDGLHIIALVAALLVLFNPYMIHNVSFQLSFIVTLGLIIGVPSIQKVLPTNKRWKWFWDLFSVTVIAQLISFPVTIYYFNQFHLLSLLANLFLVPFISMIVMPTASFVLLLGHFSTKLATPIASIVHWCNEASFFIVDRLGSVHSLYSIWATPSLMWILAWYILCFLLFNWWRNVKPTEYISNNQQETAPIEVINEYDFIHPRRKQAWSSKYRSMIIISLAMMLLLIVAYFPQFWTRTAEVSFIDVGQGDASLIRTPSGKYILVDAGGTLQYGEQEAWKARRDPFEVGKKVLLPYLMKKGVHQIDLLIMSHLDIDHIGGLKELLQTIPVKEIWWNGTYNDSAEDLFKVIISKNIPVKVPKMGERILIDKGALIDIIWPVEQVTSQIHRVEKQNEDSIVFILKIYDSTFLYTGDIGVKSEENIIQWIISQENSQIYDQYLPIDVMKVAHHGSKYSTDYSWLSFFKPSSAVISAGKNNRYGHPHPSVLNRLNEYNSLVWRTDINGEVIFKVNKNQLLIQIWK